MDHFQLELLTSAAAQDGQYRQLVIYINGVPLLDLVRAVEAPLLAAKREVAITECPCGVEVVPRPASYMYPTVGVITTSGGDFFGPAESLFTLEPSDPNRGKTCVLGCDCGEPGCWPLLVRISRTASVITWSEFSQIHRDWAYPLGPYHFKADAYEHELRRNR